MANEKMLVTAALPYANGSIHLGHMVEYIQADIFVRFLKFSGKNVIFVCADYTHGTPIEIAASKQGIPPEQLIGKYYDEHVQDFASFNINFDIYHSTNSPENRFYSDIFFKSLTEKGFIYQRLVELTYCESDNRYLPDRYVRGKCPKRSSRHNSQEAIASTDKTTPSGEGGGWGRRRCIRNRYRTDSKSIEVDWRKIETN